MSLLFKVHVLFLVLWTVSGEEPKCPGICPLIYAPVCGSDGNTYPNECVLNATNCISEEDITKEHNGPCVCGSDGNTYPNECILNAADCKSEEDITSLHDGPCKPKCPEICPLIHAPVCGSDGNTYSNECFLKVADCKSEENITIAHNGPCEPICSEICPSIYAPVCGSDGNTYPSECVLNAADCKSHEDITKEHDGPCKPKCPEICPLIHAPVCGTDGETYVNECALKVADCKSEEDITKEYDGPCVENKKCPYFCPSIFRPVCGSNDKTYPSLCNLQFADCEFENDEEITLKHDGECGEREPKCPGICPLIYRPVCGSDEKTYSNECELKAADCENEEEHITKQYNGVCVGNKECPYFCPTIYHPVCGSNNKTYPSLCNLQFADCEHENDEEITLKHEGPCEEKA